MLLLENSSPGFGWRMEIWRCASFSRVFWRRCSVDCEWRIQTARGTRKRDGQNGFFADLSCWNHVVWGVEQPATTEGCWSDNKDCLLLAATFSQWWFQRIFILKLIARDSHFDYYFSIELKRPTGFDWISRDIRASWGVRLNQLILFVGQESFKSEPTILAFLVVRTPRCTCTRYFTRKNKSSSPAVQATSFDAGSRA